MDYKSKSDTLLYHGNLSDETVAKMKEWRRKFVTLSREVEALGTSRELAIVFSSIEHAQMLVIKHLCMVDPQAQLEALDEPKKGAKK